MVEIREYRTEDAGAVGRLIAETYESYNLGFLPPEEREAFLGPFFYASSPTPDQEAKIGDTISSEIVLVAADGGDVVGVLRGRRGRLASLFVRGDRHREGIGRRLVEGFEAWSREQGVQVIRLAATTYAVPFYLKMGYKRSTGLRVGWSFEGHGLPNQPMRKVLS